MTAGVACLVCVFLIAAASYGLAVRVDANRDAPAEGYVAFAAQLRFAFDGLVAALSRGAQPQ